MRLASALVLALTMGLNAGCNSNHGIRDASFFNPLRQLGLATGEDTVQIDVALIQRPLGDAYLNRELWDLADEQAVAFEAKAALDDNGFRVGLIGGMTPAGLQALLTSERSCAEPRTLHVRAGNDVPAVLSPIVTHCQFNLHEKGRSSAVQLEQAQCLLQIVPGPAANGKVLLHFTPHVKHGHETLAPQATQDPSGARHWDLRTQQPTEKYERLGWDVSLAANEYVVIGTCLDRVDTLGQRCFLSDDAKPVQRLLVLRAYRAEPGSDPKTGPFSKSPPLALQAGWSTVRGTSD